MSNPWDNDPVVGAAPAPATATASGPWDDDPLVEAPAVPAPSATPLAAAPWDKDPVINDATTPAPDLSTVVPLPAVELPPAAQAATSLPAPPGVGPAVDLRQQRHDAAAQSAAGSGVVNAYHAAMQRLITTPGALRRVLERAGLASPLGPTERKHQREFAGEMLPYERDTASGLVGEALGNVPSMGLALLNPPAGLGVMAAEAAGRQYQEQDRRRTEENQQIDPLVGDANAVGNAAAELLMERYGMGVLKKFGQRIVTGTLKRSLPAEVLKMLGQQGLEEAATQVVQNAIDRHTIAPETGYTDDALRAGAQGVIAGGVMVPVAVAASKLSGPWDADPVVTEPEPAPQQQQQPPAAPPAQPPPQPRQTVEDVEAAVEAAGERLPPQARELIEQPQQQPEPAPAQSQQPQPPTPPAPPPRDDFADRTSAQLAFRAQVESARQPAPAAAAERAALNEYLSEHDASRGQVPAREPYLPSRDEAFAAEVNAPGSRRKSDSAITPGRGLETVQEAIETGERLGYRPEDIAAYLKKNYQQETHEVQQQQQPAPVVRQQPPARPEPQAGPEDQQPRQRPERQPQGPPAQGLSRPAAQQPPAPVPAPDENANHGSHLVGQAPPAAAQVERKPFISPEGERVEATEDEWRRMKAARSTAEKAARQRLSSLTLPELRVEAQRRGVRPTGTGRTDYIIALAIAEAREAAPFTTTERTPDAQQEWQEEAPAEVPLRKDDRLLTRNTKPGEKPWRITHFYPNDQYWRDEGKAGKPSFHEQFDSYAEAKRWLEVHGTGPVEVVGKQQGSPASTGASARKDLSSPGGSSEPAPQILPKRKAAVKEKPARPKRTPFTRPAVERKLADFYDAERSGQQTVDDSTIESQGKGRPFTFLNKLPGEVRNYLENNPSARRLFKVTGDPDNAGGSDAMSELGEDEYFRIADTYTKQNLENIKKLTRSSVNPVAQFWTAVHDNLPPPRERPAQQAVDPHDLQAGQEFELNGEKFQVVEDPDDGYLVLKDGADYPVTPIDVFPEGEKIPVDKGTLQQADASGALTEGLEEAAPPKKFFTAADSGVTQSGIFGQSVIDSSGVGEQRPMFHEPNAAPPVQTEKIKASANALDPKNTAEMFRGEQQPKEQPKPKGIGDARRAEVFRKQAEGLQSQIDDRRRPMTQNPTPKRNRERGERLNDATQLENTQKALRALAEAHDAGTVPPELAGIKTKGDVAPLVRRKIKHDGGYYDPGRLLDEYEDTSPAGKALQAMIEPKGAQQRAEAEAAARRARIELAEQQAEIAGIPSFFATPKVIAERMVREAGVKRGDKVLEPSAGNGNIADALAAVVGRENVDTYETHQSLRDILGEKGYRLTGRDFTEAQPQPKYDAIVMNPPFEKGQDIEHVRRAYEHLKPGGRLVAIMSEGSFSRGDRKATEFREWLDDLEGSSEQLASGTFRTTGAASRLVVIDKAGTDPLPLSLTSDAVGARTRSMTAASVLRSLAPIRREFAAQRIEVVQSEANLPRSARRAIAREGVTGRVEAMVSPDGGIYVIADAIGSAAHAARVAFHEIVGHVGVDAALSPKVREEIVRHARQHDPALVARVRRDYGAESPGEIIARLAERFAGEPRPAWYRQVLRAIRFHWRRLTGQHFDDRDVEHALLYARRAAAVRRAGRDDVATSLAAWHGTPYDFDQFTTAKIGTGEGAAAYGWGLYFASRREVAEHYKNRLSEHNFWEYEGEEVTERQAAEKLAEMLAPHLSQAQRDYKQPIAVADDLFYYMRAGYTPGEAIARMRPALHSDRAAEVLDDFLDGLTRPHKVDRDTWVPVFEKGERTLRTLGHGERMAYWDIKGRLYWKNTKNMTPEQALAAVVSELERTVSAQRSNLRDHATHGGSAKSRDETKRTLLEALTSLRVIRQYNVRAKLVKPAGRLYEVVLSPEDHELLDWDKPISQQSDHVKRALREAGYVTEDARDLTMKQVADYLRRYLHSQQAQRDVDSDIGIRQSRREAFDRLQEYQAGTPGGLKRWWESSESAWFRNHLGMGEASNSGELFYESLAIDEARAAANKPGGNLDPRVSDPRAASMRLHEMGIRGIRYLDGQSRSSGEGSYNYVIFNEGDVNIRAKFSLRPARGAKPGFEFEDEGVEQRYRAARGAPQPSVFERVRGAVADTVQGFRRHFEHLDTSNAADAKLANVLRIREARLQAAPAHARRAVESFVKDLSPAEYDTFGRLLVLPDIVKDVEAGLYDGKELPFGFTDKAHVEREIDRLKARATPRVNDALRRRNAEQRKLAERLVALNLLPEGVLADERYYHRQVMQYLELRERATIGGTGPDAKLRKRGFQRQRTGGGDFNTAYEQAEHEYLTHALRQIATAEALERIKAEFDVSKRLRVEARKRNNAAAEAVALTDPDAAELLSDANAKIARAIAELEEEAEGDADLAGMGPVDLANHVLSHEADFVEDTLIAARTLFKGIGEKRALVRQLAGEKYVEMKDLVPEGHTVWSPKAGTTFARVLTLTEDVLAKLVSGELSAADAKVREMFARVPGEQLVIPEHFADQLDSQPDEETTALGQLNAGLLTSWKQYKLLNPLAALRYNLNNLSGDLDVALAADPRIIGAIPAAARDLAAYARHAAAPDAEQEIRQALELGVLDSGENLHEIPDISQEGVFRKLTGGRVNPVNWYWSRVRGATTLRENAVRLAAFRRAKQLVAEGKNPLWASPRKELEAVTDPTERAAKLARDLIGDYGNVSVSGQVMRRRYVPFWSWMEINAPRYLRLFVNAPSGKKAPVAAAAVGGLAVRAALLYGLIHLFNRIVWPDEDDGFEDGRLRLIVGKTPGGRLIDVRFQGAFSDALSWLGLEQAPGMIARLYRGEVDAGDVAEDVALATPRKLVNAAAPIQKTLAEAATGKSLFPDPFNPRAIRDKGEHVARLVDLDGAYRAAKDIPQDSPMLRLVANTRDPGEQAYHRVRGAAGRWLDDNNVQRGSGEPTERSNALYYHKKALAMGDRETASKWLREYFKLGGTGRGLRQSIDMAHPLAMVPQKNRGGFLSSLSAGQRQDLRKAIDWWRRTYLTGGSSVGAVSSATSE